MKLPSVALLGLAFLAGCASSPSATTARPVVSATAATQSLNDADKAFVTDKFNKAMETALIGQAVSWTTPNGDYQFQVTATRTYQPDDSGYCREFTQSIAESKGVPTSTHGTACRQSDGTWQITG